MLQWTRKTLAWNGPTVRLREKRRVAQRPKDVNGDVVRPLNSKGKGEEEMEVTDEAIRANARCPSLLFKSQGIMLQFSMV